MDGRMKRNWIVVAGFWGALGVVFGAFGAHYLKSRLTIEGIGWWDTATLYHLLHAPAIGLAGLLAEVRGRGTKAAPLLLGGAAVFSGTLYAMSLGAPRILGAVTPLGGALLIVGWIFLALEARRP